MRVEIFCLCDAATDNAGKLNILGAFDTFYAPQLPFVYPFFCVALRMRFDSTEMGAHNVVVNFMDVDGKHVIQPAAGTLNITSPGSANLILNIQNLQLKRVGEYAIDLSVDGKNEATLALFVRQK